MELPEIKTRKGEKASRQSVESEDSGDSALNEDEDLLLLKLGCIFNVSTSWIN